MIPPTMLRAVLFALVLLSSSPLPAIVIENLSPYALTVSLWAQLPAGTSHVQVFTETLTACTDSARPPKIIKSITTLYRALANKKCHFLWDGTLKLDLVFINVPFPSGSRDCKASLFFIEPNRHEQALRDRGLAGGGASALAAKSCGYDSLQTWDLGLTKLSLGDYKPEMGAPIFTMKPRCAEDRGVHTALLPPVGYEPPRLLRTKTYETASTEGRSPSSIAPTPRPTAAHTTGFFYESPPRTPHSPRHREAAGGAGAAPIAEEVRPAPWGGFALPSYPESHPRVVTSTPRHHASPGGLAVIHEASGHAARSRTTSTASPRSSLLDQIATAILLASDSLSSPVPTPHAPGAKPKSHS